MVNGRPRVERSDRDFSNFMDISSKILRDKGYEGTFSSTRG